MAWRIYLTNRWSVFQCFTFTVTGAHIFWFICFKGFVCLQWKFWEGNDIVDFFTQGSNLRLGNNIRLYRTQGNNIIQGNNITILHKVTILDYIELPWLFSRGNSGLQRWHGKSFGRIFTLKHRVIFLYLEKRIWNSMLVRNVKLLVMFFAAVCKSLLSLYFNWWID